MSTRRVSGMGLAAVVLALMAGGREAAALQAPAGQSSDIAERTVWYFYKVRWGFQEEFVALFKKNHLPVLKAQQEAGRIATVRAFAPTNHGDGRADWTFAVAVTFPTAAAMHSPSNEDAIVKRLYPDQATFKKEEQRRFEILDAHWDVPLNELDLDKK